MKFFMITAQFISYPFLIKITYWSYQPALYLLLGCFHPGVGSCLSTLLENRSLLTIDTTHWQWFREQRTYWQINLFQKKGVKKSTFNLDIGVSIWYNTTMNENRINSEAYQVNVHALYDRNTSSLTYLEQLRRQKKISLMVKQSDLSLDIVTPICYNTTINNKER